MKQNNDITVLLRLKRKTLVLRIELIIFGLLALFIGLYPLLLERKLLPGLFQSLPVEGSGYRTVIMLVGALALVLGIRASQKRNL